MSKQNRKPSPAEQQNREAAEVLAPESRQVEAGGKSYEAKRLETRQVWPTLRAALPIFGALVALVGPTGSSPAADSPLGSSSQPDGPRPDSLPASQSPLAQMLGNEIATLLEVFAEHGERITEILAIGYDVPVSTVGRWEPQEAYLALKALIAVNKDFFTTRVAPLLGLQEGQPVSNALAGAVGQAVKSMQDIGAGATPSSS
jgi:hypothetical protein